MSDTVVAAIVGAIALIGSTWLSRRPTKTLKATKKLAEKAVEQTEKTGNGFAKETKEQLQQLHKSLGAVHRRLDHQTDILTNFDNRLVHLEESDDDEAPPHVH